MRRMSTWAVHATARLTVAFVWIWHGVVPKLLGPHEDEWLMLTDAGIEKEQALLLVQVAGWCELVFGVLIALNWRWRWTLLLTIVLMLGAIAGLAVSSPHYFLRAFNPVTLNVATAVLALIALVTADRAE